MPRPSCQSPEEQQGSDASGEERDDEELPWMQGWGGGEGLAATLWAKSTDSLSKGWAFLQLAGAPPATAPLASEP